MDMGEGGCNDNIIFGNDFFYVFINGIEVIFSCNIIVENWLEECCYGIWGGYSYESLMCVNIFSNCDYGIVIEYGQDNIILYNSFDSCEVGIKLWEWVKQFEDWGYV